MTTSQSNEASKTNEFPIDAVRVPMVSIDWYRSAPWWRLLTAVLNVSWRASHLLFCAAGLVVLQLLDTVLRFLFRPEGDIGLDWISGRSFTIPVPLSSVLYFGVQPPSSFLEIWGTYLQPVSVFLLAPSVRTTAFCTASALGSIAVWAFIGGCLARRTVLECGAKSTAPWNETIRLVKHRWQSICWSVTMPACMLGMLCLIPLSLGWVSNIPWIGTPIAGILMIPCMFLSIALGWIGAITLMGFPMSVTAIVTEKKADAFDGVSRSAAYAFQRPILLMLAILLCNVLSILGGELMAILFGFGSGLTMRFFEIGSFKAITELGSFASWVIGSITPLLLSAFSFSFFWSANAVIYLLLRKDIDHTEFDSVDLPTPVATSAPQSAASEVPLSIAATSNESSNPDTSSENTIS